MTADLDRTIAHLADLIAFPSVSRDSNLPILDHIRGILINLGARIEFLPSPCGTKANLFATLGPNRPGGVVLSGHSDVVPVDDQEWSSDPFALWPDDGRLYGRGTCDMKGFIAACLTVAEGLDVHALERPIHICLTHDEEVGCIGARALLPQLARLGYRPSMAIVGEPTEMQVVDGHKGCCEYVTRFHGLAGHGSQPDQGVNAVAYAARYAGRLLDLVEGLKARRPSDSPFDPPWSTINIGLLNGGVGLNVIPSTAELGWEMRPVQQSDLAYVKDQLATFQATELLPAMTAISRDAGIMTEVIGEVRELTPEAVNPARDLAMYLTGANAAQTVPFNTEAGLFQTEGIPSVLCGPGSIAQAHKADEFIAIDQLAKCLTFLDGVAQYCMSK
ncbi:acetylornithine deacetylase [Pseudoprimorskyibacter insulae]|uniref:Acetylornithine deacetylase n=1 Tax=Pseudoprimorskyibacter insulae TaxID=1695997 RepID=A0A2R8ANK9_9RHOB|nr:acetylornithine deacetylase [Pseudoprimorskyibacter insulae]SPF77477.1 Acetylornithine deacetylase [Pseudoprimorskyibacter insulae]